MTSEPMPTWVKLMLIVVGVLALAVVAHLVIGGHGPDRHAAAGTPGPGTPPEPHR